MNVARARLVQEDGLVLRVGPHALRLPASEVERRPELGGRVGQDVVVGIRPTELCADTGTTADDAVRLEAVISVTEVLGTEVDAHFTIEDASVEHRDAAALTRELDDGLAPIDAAATSVRWTARLSRRDAAGPGERLALRVDPAALYLFDPRTGLNLRAGRQGAAGAATDVPRSTVAHR